MARRRRNELDELFELWARWCYGGSSSNMAGPSLLARWMDSKGHIVFGASSAGPTNSVEERIEAAVFALSTREPMTARVLRWEHGVGSEVWGWRGDDDNAKALTQADKAQALGISLRTYRRRLAAARAEVEARLAQ